MKMFNKVLAILNVLAVVVFLIIAALDYGQRHSWSFLVLQEDFILKGLPVDNEEKDVDGNPAVNSVGKTMQERLFAGVGTPVQTQVEEVPTRHDALRDQINESGDQLKKLEELRKVLEPLARTWGERHELQLRIEKQSRLILEGKPPSEDLMGPDGPFEAAFKDALELKGGPQRQAIAHLLFNLAGRDDWQRVAVIVGVEAYAKEVDAQATAYRDMIPELQNVMAGEQTAFEVSHRALLQQIIALADRVRDLDETHQKQLALLDQHKTAVTKRQQDVADLKAQIEAAKKLAATALSGQSSLEKSLFEADRALQKTTQTNQQLEREIRTRELRR